MEEYEKAKTFSIADLDNETYAKFENTYILDRYEMRKPYFITGDDGLKKRIDLYKLISKTDKQELGLIIFYTSETGKRFQACLPNFTADSKVWEKYFEDIHAIDKVEKNFVLKLSYILSKEVSFQSYKSINQGKDLSKESATYGNDICFPGDEKVRLSNGSTKRVSELKPGDAMVSVDASSGKPVVTPISNIIRHEPKNYAITQLHLLHTSIISTEDGDHITLKERVIQATPNHPMATLSGKTTMGDIKIGDKITGIDAITGEPLTYTVWEVKAYMPGVQAVYSITTNDEHKLLLNDVIVLQK
jgi:hypothetical protein